MMCLGFVLGIIHGAGFPSLQQPVRFGHLRQHLQVLQPAIKQRCKHPALLRNSMKASVRLGSWCIIFSYEGSPVKRHFRILQLENARTVPRAFSDPMHGAAWWRRSPLHGLLPAML